MSFNESLGKLWRVVSSKCCSTRASMSGYDCTFFCLINHFDVKLRGRFEWIRIPSNSSRLLSSVLSTSNPISSTILLNIFPDLEKYFQKFPILLIFISSRNQMLIHLTLGEKLRKCAFKEKKISCLKLFVVNFNRSLGVVAIK